MNKDVGAGRPSIDAEVLREKLDSVLDQNRALLRERYMLRHDLQEAQVDLHGERQKAKELEHALASVNERVERDARSCAADSIGFVVDVIYDRPSWRYRVTFPGSGRLGRVSRVAFSTPEAAEAAAMRHHGFLMEANRQMIESKSRALAAQQESEAEGKTDDV